MKHQLPALPWEYGALEPHIDEQTMRIHHSKHHQAYVNNLNAVLEKYPEYADREIEHLITNLTSLKMEEADRTALRNNGGGHANHSLFWSIMGPKKARDESLAKRLTETFGSVDEFKSVFTQTAVKIFGSGWAWLVEDSAGALSVYSLPNQDSPLSEGHTPILGLDVWEHAYYLKYQNLRADYIAAWWNVVTLI